MSIKKDAKASWKLKSNVTRLVSESLKTKNHDRKNFKSSID